MIVGIGVDICDISRMKALLEDERFLSRYFAPSEIEYIKNKGANKAQSAAGIFAAKEAALKALGVGLRLDLKLIIIDHLSSGKPYYRLIGKALEKMKSIEVSHTHLSISHEGASAVAFAIFEGNING